MVVIVDGKKCNGKVGLVYGYLGFVCYEVEFVYVGDIIVIIGFGEFKIFDIICDINIVEVFFLFMVDEFIVIMMF